MTPWTLERRTACMVAILLVSSGCRTIYPGQKPLTGPQPRISPAVPRELSMVTMPDYIIEPPDILSIEAVSLLPKTPYRLRPLDSVSVSSTGLVPVELNLLGEFVVQPNGMIQLGDPLGAIHAAGRTVEELQDDILARARQTYREAEIFVTLSQLSAQQQIIGEHLVAPDGKVNLGTYGRVRVVGLTIEEARAVVEDHLSQYLEDPQISLDVLGYNSKVFYVVTQGAGLGDGVIILPSRGNETVIDAIGQIQGLTSNSSTRMWIARPGSNQCGGDQILPIDWLAVTQRGDTTTNYQILPGDRLYVSEDKLVALDTALGKLISPMERIFGFTLLGTQTISRAAFTGGLSGAAGSGGGGGF